MCAGNRKDTVFNWGSAFTKLPSYTINNNGNTFKYTLIQSTTEGKLFASTNLNVACEKANILPDSIVDQAFYTAHDRLEDETDKNINNVQTKDPYGS